MERNDIFPIIITIFITRFIKMFIKEINTSKLNNLYKKSIIKSNDI